MQSLLGRLQKWHENQRPELLDELAPPASDADIERLRARVGDLPEAYVALMKWHDGTRDGCFSGFWFNRQLMSVARTLDAMSIMDELNDAGEFDHEYWWRTKWVPFLDNGGGDHVCIDLEGCFGGKPGQIVEFWHDDEDRTVSFPDLQSWLACFVEALEADLFEDDEGDLQTTDDDALDALVATRCPGYPKHFDADGESLDDDDDDD